ncbi:hypothetical protein GGF42_002947 [Coemansia sp. RSA 2424]|nr:hypothetical protein GGF42_002947 [Coemansia sp. RSA 2424]
MFRKGPPKHPKLNPVGISSKDFFSANQPPPLPLSEHGLATKGSKLARKLSSLSSSSHLPAATPSLAVSPQSLTPKSTNIPAFSSSAAVSSLGCLSDSDTMDDLTHSVSATSAMPHTPTGSRCLTQQQRLDRSLPQIGRSAGYEVRCNSFGTAELPQRRRPSRLKLDAVHVSERAVTSMDTQLPRSHDSAVSAHFPPTLPHQSHTGDDSSPRDPAAVSPSALLAMYADAERGLSAGESRKRGALWRAKLSFTNLRRPESRRQRHQSFDSNSVDIAAHPRMYSESPLVSVPSAAPASARSRSPGIADYEQHRLDGLLCMSASSYHSRLAQSPGMPGSGYSDTTDLSCGGLGSVGDMGTIDKDFLLTIQRNSALEARRQRRRETRRNTMSFLSSANMPSPQHESASLVSVAPVDFAQERALAGESSSSPPSADKTRPRQSHDENWRLASSQIDRAASGEIGCLDTSTNCGAGETADHEACCADGLKGSNGIGIMPVKGSPSGTRPNSLDSLTYTEQAVAGSSRPSSSVCGGKQALVPDNLCNDNGYLHRPQSRHSAAARTYCSSKGVDTDACVPPVPPLPTHIALVARHQRSTDDSDMHSDALVRPVTANACGSPRFVADTRRYRGSASVLPTTVDLSPRQNHLSPAPLSAGLAPPPLRSLNLPMSAALAASSWEAEAIRLQRYRMAPSSGRHYPDATTNGYSPVTTSQSSTNSGSTLAAEQTAESLAESQLGVAKHLPPLQPLSAHVGRKFSQPEAQLAATSRPLDLPTQPSGILSKSSPHINMRSSVDGNKPNTKGSNASNVSGAKHGIGRLFSATPPGRKSHLGPHHLTTSPAHTAQQLQPPTSPTVSLLVGDPMARRKIRDQLASSRAFDRLLEEDGGFTMAISLTPSVAGMSPATAPSRQK